MKGMYLSRRFYRTDVRLGVVDPRCRVHGGTVTRHCADRFPGCCRGVFRGDTALPGLARVD